MEQVDPYKKDPIQLLSNKPPQDLTTINGYYNDPALHNASFIPQALLFQLSLLGLKYQYNRVNLLGGEQREDWFLKLNLQGKIPVLVDVNDKGEEYALPESCAILMYLGEKYDKEHKYYYGADAGSLYWDQMRWLFFADSTCASKLNQAFVYNVFSQEDLPTVKKNTVAELKDVMSLLETRLQQNNGWLVGDHVNITDIAAYATVINSARVGVEVAKEFPILNQWVEKMAAIPGLEEGRDFQLETF